MLSPITLIFESSIPDNAGASPVALESLEAHGFQTIRCADLTQLTQQARLHALPNRRILVILAAEIAENCVTANYLRTLHPNLGILAMSDSADESSLIRLIQSGVDNTCTKDASVALVVTILFRMLARVGQCVPAAIPQPVSAAPETGSWFLSEQDWVMVSPEGKRIPLTTGERAFMLALLNAPDHRVPHADLIAAVNQAYDDLSEPDHRQNRLSVLVSRLRAKCNQHNVKLPLKSVHRWGYMFSGQY
ncbi:winged helix-turn-helix domain-containing protein [Alcaligenaceae bacterium]|nr:winged helix-turn-helix domain-containing protein [Alcaligenaceae bacterium]